MPQQHLVLVHPAYNIQQHVALGLEHDYPAVIEDDVVGGLRRLVDKALLECGLLFEGGVRVRRRCVGMRRVVVFG